MSKRTTKSPAKESKPARLSLPEPEHDFARILSRYIGDAPLMVWIKDENFRYVFCNPLFEKTFRVKFSDIQGKTDFDIWPEKIAAQFRENDRAVFASSKSMNTVEWNPSPDGGTAYWNVCKFVMTDELGRRYVAGQAFDMTLQKQEEDRIRFQAMVLDQVRNCVIAMDPQGKILFWNRFAEMLYQWKSSEVLGKDVFQLVVPEEEASKGKEILAGLLGGGYWEGEFTVKRKDGKRFPVFSTNSPLKDDNGKFIGFISITADLTDYRAAKNALEEKNIALKEILSQLEIEKRAIRKRFSENLEKNVLPILAKMKKMPSSDTKELGQYLQILENSLKETSSSPGHVPATLSALNCLAPRELEVCGLIRNNLSNKEIAAMLSISPATVETHRVRIRRKLGIHNLNINLTTYLQTL